MGVWKGNSLGLYLRLIKSLDGHVYLIDWWKGSKAVEKDKEMSFRENSYEEAYQEVLDVIDKFDAHDHVTILRGDSAEMAEQIPDGELDMCFIDADHTYKGCKRDIQAYLPKVKKGGIMAGDDLDSSTCFYSYLTHVGTFTEEDVEKDAVFEKGHPGVHRAVWDEFGINVNPFNDGGYTFKGYHIVRVNLGIVDINDHKDVHPFLPVEKNSYLTTAHSLLIPENFAHPKLVDWLQFETEGFGNRYW